MKLLSTISGSLRTCLALAAATAILIGCGGGDGGSTPASTTGTTGSTGSTGSTGTVQILDSFGQVVSPGGADSVGVGDSGTDGTAGEGNPIVNGTVEVTDTAGKKVTAITDSQGYYRVKVTGFTPPFVAKVTSTTGKVYRSLSVKSLVVNGFITLNITGLTDKVASDVARAAGKSGAADLTPQIVAQNPAAIASSINSIKSLIAPVITAAAIDPNTFDPLGVPFRPNATGYDFVLDNTKVTVAADGSTQLAISPTFTGGTGLAGTWGFVVAVTVQGQTQTAASTSDIPGSGVPKDAATATNFCTSGQSQAFTSNGVTGTVTCSGNTVTVVSSTGTISDTYNLANYQGCGACGVGSQVVVTYNVTDVMTLPGGAGTSTTNYTAVVTYTRKS